jgi:hypothetical protein
MAEGRFWSAALRAAVMLGSPQYVRYSSPRRPPDIADLRDAISDGYRDGFGHQGASETQTLAVRL